MTIRLSTLGQIDLRDEAGTELRSLLTQPKRFALLVYLAATATERLCRRDTLLAMFWPESDSDRARAALRQALHFIRQAAGADIVVTRGADEIGLQPGTVALDSAAMEALADAGRNDEALAAYQGDFLDGFFVRGAPEFERWMSGERDRLRRRAAECAWLVVEQQVASNDLTAARATAERAVRLSADSEIAVRRFIELLARSGDRAAALSVYREFSAHLADEFGVQPSRETLALVAELSRPRATPLPFAASTLGDGPLGGETASLTQLAKAANTKHRVPRTGLLAFVLVLVLGAMYTLQRTLMQRSPALDPNRIAVLPFMVKGAPDLRYLHDGLPLLLSTRLDGIVNIHVVDMRAVLLEQSRRGADSLSPESATRTANTFGAGLYIVGNIVGSSNALTLDASLYDGTHPDAPIARAQQTGSEADIVPMVDRLTAALLADRFKSRGGLVAEMAARTTTSFVALKAWLEGESEMARGRYVPAITSFRTAIAADTMFAMAYYRLAVAAAWSGDLGLVGPSAQRAVLLSDQLPPSARTIVKAFLDSRSGRYADAERAERQLLAERPASIDVWFDLGEVLYHANPARGRPITEAREAFEQLLRMDPTSFAAMSHLARLAAARGDAKALDSLSRLALAGEPDGPHRAELLLLRALSLNDHEARAAVLAMPQDLVILDAFWRAAEYTENLQEISAIARTRLANAPTDEMRASLFLFLAHAALGREDLDLAQGYIDSLSAHAPQYGATTEAIMALHPAVRVARPALVARALASIAKAETIHSANRVYAGASRRDDGSPYMAIQRALLLAATGSPAAAQSLLLKTDTKTGQTSNAELQIAIATDDAQRADAITHGLSLDTLYGNSYGPQHPLSPRVALHLELARMLHDAGRDPEALARLATIPEDFGFNIGFLAEVHRRRAEILTRLGRTAEAARERQAVIRLTAPDPRGP